MRLDHVQAAGEGHGHGDVAVDDEPAFRKTLARAALRGEQQEGGFQAFERDDQIGRFRSRASILQDASALFYGHARPTGEDFHHETETLLPMGDLILDIRVQFGGGVERPA